jgi:hypothetical protein
MASHQPANATAAFRHPPQHHAPQAYSYPPSYKHSPPQMGLRPVPHAQRRPGAPSLAAFIPTVPSGAMPHSNGFFN